MAKDEVMKTINVTTAAFSTAIREIDGPLPEMTRNRAKLLSKNMKRAREDLGWEVLTGERRVEKVIDGEVIPEQTNQPGLLPTARNEAK